MHNTICLSPLFLPAKLFVFQVSVIDDVNQAKLKIMNHPMLNVDFLLVLNMIFDFLYSIYAHLTTCDAPNIHGHDIALVFLVHSPWILHAYGTPCTILIRLTLRFKQQLRIISKSHRSFLRQCMAYSSYLKRYQSVYGRP